MKFFKKTVFWVLMFAVLGGSFFIFDKKTEEKKAVEEIKKRLFAFGPDDVSSISIKRKEGESLTLKKEGDVWMLTSPVTAPAHKENVDKFLDKVVNAKLDGILFEKTPEGKLEEMGLTDPYLTVEFTRSGNANTTINFGDPGPTNNVSFAVIKDDPRIYRIMTDVRADADKAVYDMREKTIFTFDPTKVKNFDVKWAEGERIIVEHPSEGKWNAMGLSEGKTDFLKVMEMLIKFKKSEIKAFVEEEAKDLKLYGLDAPRVRLLFNDETGVRHSIMLGERDKQRRGIYAIIGGEKKVILLEEEVYDTIPRKVSDLEDKGDAEVKP